MAQLTVLTALTKGNILRLNGTVFLTASPLKARGCFMFLFLLMLINCQSSPDSTDSSASFTDETAHQEDVSDWFRQRLERLNSDRGWLKLAGLFWLDDGLHSFGSAPENDIVMPQGAIRNFAGDVILEGNMITVDPAEDDLLYVNGEALKGSLTFPVENELEFVHDRLAWQFIQRGELIGLRLFDQQSEVSRNFKGIDRFPVSGKYRVEARLVPHDPPRKLPVVNILGQTNEYETPGMLEFEIEGQSYSLIPQSASDGERLFIVLADETSGKQTFGGGRFLYADNPGPGNSVVLDFNKAYNPPCSFSEYTTCPLPPPENRLQLAIEAGEKRYR